VVLALWCVSFAIGIAVSAGGGASVGVGGVAGGLFLAGGLWSFVRGRWRLTGGALVWLGLGFAYAPIARAPARLDPTLKAAIASEAPVAIVARVVHGPEVAARGARLTLQIERLDPPAGEAASPAAPAPAPRPSSLGSQLGLSVVSGWPDFAPGERVQVSARLRALRGLSNPGLPDPTFALRSAGVDLLAGVGDPSAIARLPAADVSMVARLRALAFRARCAMRAATDRALTRVEATFLQTAVLGDRRGVDPGTEAGFRAAGATHLLSVSGLHLAAVAVIFLVGLRAILGRIPRLPLYVDPRAVAAGLALPAVAFFVMLTGEAVATLRSALMIGVALAAPLVNRPVSPAATLGAAGLVLLLGSPLLLFDVSLQLSLASVAGIALLARALGPRRRGAAAPGGRVVIWLWRFGAASVAATAVTAPLGAHHFGEVAPASPIGNLVLVPLVEMVVVPFGLAGAALAVVWPAAGGIPLRIAGLGARLALAAARLFRAYAPLWLCRAPNVFETLALVAAAVMALGAAAGPWSRGARRRRLFVGAALALLAATASLTAREIARRTDPDLRVTFLDVGQGDAALVEAPGGGALLIDGGGSFDGSFDPGERVIEPLLRVRGIDRLDLVALSHPHPDHLNGLQRVLERFRVTRLWTSGDDGHNPDYARLLATARRRGVALPVPAPLRVGALALTPLGPWLGDRIGVPEGLSVNDASLVVRLDFAGRGAIFPGDLEADGEGELVGRRALGAAIAADLLKVPHHGSRTSSSPELVDAVAPALAVISLGWQNRFHFPDAAVVARYAARGTRVLRTDRDGAITVRIDPTGALAVTCNRGCPPTPMPAAR
jgi:competence protein ComEC